MTPSSRAAAAGRTSARLPVRAKDRVRDRERERASEPLAVLSSPPPYPARMRRAAGRNVRVRVSAFRMFARFPLSLSLAPSLSLALARSLSLSLLLPAPPTCPTQPLHPAASEKITPRLRHPRAPSQRPTLSDSAETLFAARPRAAAVTDDEEGRRRISDQRSPVGHPSSPGDRLHRFFPLGTARASAVNATDHAGPAVCRHPDAHGCRA